MHDRAAKPRRAAQPAEEPTPDAQRIRNALAAKPKKASKAKMNRELMMRVHKLGVVHAPRNASANE